MRLRGSGQGQVSPSSGRQGPAPALSRPCETWLGEAPPSPVSQVPRGLSPGARTQVLSSATRWSWASPPRCAVRLLALEVTHFPWQARLPRGTARPRDVLSAEPCTRGQCSLSVLVRCSLCCPGCIAEDPAPPLTFRVPQEHVKVCDRHVLPPTTKPSSVEMKTPRKSPSPPLPCTQGGPQMWWEGTVSVTERSPSSQYPLLCEINGWFAQVTSALTSATSPSR